MSKADKKNRHHLHIELTPAQYRLLTDQARQYGLTKRALLVRLIEGNPVRARPSQEIKDLHWEAHKIGVNIDQIARSVNTGIARADDAGRGLFLLDQVYKLMYQIAKKQAYFIIQTMANFPDPLFPYCKSLKNPSFPSLC